MIGIFFVLMLSDPRPIGIFDSGVGGITIWKEITSLLPSENTVYLADSANAPYGVKPQDEIKEISQNNAQKLVGLGAKIIVVACNTATTNAIDHLRQNFQVPIIGIEPATKPAAISSKTGVIGILATKGTLASELFLNTSQKYKGSTTIIERIGSGLVPIIESGDLEAARPLLVEYLQPMIEQGADNIVLGCSHYPFLIPIIKEIVPAEVNIIDSGYAVARHTKNTLESLEIASNAEQGQHQFLTNANETILNAFLKKVQAESYSIKAF